MTPQLYVLLAFFFAVVFSLGLLIKRVAQMAEQAEAIAKRQEEADAALREHVKVSGEKLEVRIQRLMEAELKAQQALETLLRAQHVAIDANSKATDQLAGAVQDLRAALIESTKL